MKIDESYEFLACTMDYYIILYICMSIPIYSSIHLPSSTYLSHILWNETCCSLLLQTLLPQSVSHSFSGLRGGSVELACGHGKNGCMTAK